MSKAKKPTTFAGFLKQVRAELRKPIFRRIHNEVAPGKKKAKDRWAKLSEETRIPAGTLSGCNGGTTNLSVEKTERIQQALNRVIEAAQKLATDAVGDDREPLRRRAAEVKQRIEELDLSFLRHPHAEINAEAERRFKAYQGGAVTQDPDVQPEQPVSGNGQTRVPALIDPKQTNAPFFGSNVAAFVMVTPPGSRQGCGLVLPEGQEVTLRAGQGGGINISIPAPKAEEEPEE